jgi:hypothetical protein
MHNYTRRFAEKTAIGAVYGSIYTSEYSGFFPNNRAGFLPK